MYIQYIYNLIRIEIDKMEAKGLFNSAPKNFREALPFHLFSVTSQCSHGTSQGSMIGPISYVYFINHPKILMELLYTYK